MSEHLKVLADIATAPPCRLCRFWRLEVKEYQAWGYDGVIMCHAEEMEHDFSCFRAKQAKGAA